MDQVIKGEKGEKEYRNTDTQRVERGGRIRKKQTTTTTNHDRNIRNVERNTGEKCHASQGRKAPMSQLPRGWSRKGPQPLSAE